MDYQKIHDQILEKRKREPLSKEIYSEKHHILPRSLGGSNGIGNTIRLTAREHFIVHLLLVRIYPKGSLERSKMLWALKRMRYGNKEQKEIKNSARLYSYHRSEFSEMMSKRLKGKRFSLDHRAKISASKTGKQRYDIERYSEAALKLWENQEYAKKQADARIDRKLSVSHKANIGKSLEGSKRSEETKLKIKATKIANRLANPENHDKHMQCDHCSIKTNAGNLARYHNDKCKSK